MVTSKLNKWPGIDFSASEGSGTSSTILDDYEIGTFTATITVDSGLLC